jgi:proline iminopeptidase
MSNDSYIDVPGGRVWYETVGQGGAGIPLLTLHGGPGFPHDYIRSLEDLADERPVVFYDQLGCGRSERPDNPDLWTTNRFVDELSILRKHLKLDKVHILGQSWGTMLAVDYALKEPVGIQSIVLASPPLSIPRWLKDAEQNRLKLPADVQKTLTSHESAGTTDSAEYQQADRIYTEHFICRLSPTPADVQRSREGFGKQVYSVMWGPSESYMKGSRLEHYDRVDRLKELKMPVLYTCGRFDEASPEATAWYHKETPGSELIIFENSSHMAHLEERDAYMAAIRAFLRRCD